MCTTLKLGVRLLEPRSPGRDKNKNKNKNKTKSSMWWSHRSSSPTGLLPKNCSLCHIHSFLISKQVEVKNPATSHIEEIFKDFPKHTKHEM